MRKIVFLFVVLFTLFVQSCDYYSSEVPISSSENSVIDTSLIGRWVNAEESTPDKYDYFDIIAFNENEYLLKVPMSFNSNFESMYVFKAFNSETKNGSIYNVINMDLEEGKTYTFYKCEKLPKGLLKIYYLADDHMNMSFRNSGDLLNYINSNPDSVFNSYKEFAIVKRQKIDNNKKANSQ